MPYPVDELELTRDTLVVFFSDHGKEFWEHGSVIHSHTLYRELLHVLLLIANPETRPYIHLIDGGIADNLGLRYSIELIEAAGGADQFLEIVSRDPPEHFIVIVVNAETAPNPRIDLSSASPSFASLMGSVSGSQIRRYNLETLLLTEASLKKWTRILSEKSGKPIDSRLIEIDFNSIPQEKSRNYFKLIPTSFVLSDKTIDDLTTVGRELLRSNPEFQEFLRKLAPTPTATPSESAPLTWQEGPLPASQ